MNDAFELVPLRRGGVGIRSVHYDEICHPGVGPKAEAEEVYVRALGLRERLASEPGEFVVWDVGLGGAANAVSVIDAMAEVGGALRVISFDHSPAPLRFALEHAGSLGYFGGLEGAARLLLEEGQAVFRHRRVEVGWNLVLADFPGWLADGGAGAGRGCEPPHAILYDPHSPAANPEMWTLPVFARLHAKLDPARPCSLATYSRSTAVRVALLLAGFRVGAGRGTATKEETTVAANAAGLVAMPLEGRWLERAKRSRAAEPWVEAPFGGRPLSPETLERLLAHPQFRGMGMP